MNSHEPSPPPTAPSACPGCESLRQRLDEANRLMNAYRVKAHGLHSELDATLDRLSKSRASHKVIIADLRTQLEALNTASSAINDGMAIVIEDRDTTITSLRDSLVAANAHAAKLEREAHKDRASIVAFLAAEAPRFDRAADEFDAMDKADSADRCRTKAGHARTLAAQIERGDDRQGGE